MENKEEQGFEDKTEEASEEKRNQFREEGNVVSPREIVSAITLILFTTYFYFSGQSIVKSFNISMKRAWSGFAIRSFQIDDLVNLFLYVFLPFIPHMIFILFVCAILPTVFGLFLTQFNWSWKKIIFDIERLNPIAGIGRLVSGNSLAEFAKVIIKFAVLISLIFFVFKREITDIHKNYFFNVHDYIKSLSESVYNLLLVMCLAAVAIGILDFGYNYFKIEREMKMTKKELKDEMKKHEGDPLLKSQRKRVARDLVMRKSIREVPKATFIITNPQHISIAIRYVKGMRAPIVIAKGRDLIAMKIREIAKKNDIMIVENKPVARALFKTVKVGHEIPSSMYQAVIEVIKYIYKIRGKEYFEKFNETLI